MILNTIPSYGYLFVFNGSFNVSWFQYPKVQFSLKGFSTGDSFALKGMRDNIFRHFWLSQLGEGAMLLASSRPGIVHTLHAQGSTPQQRTVWSKMWIVLLLRSPGLQWWTPILCGPTVQVSKSLAWSNDNI